MINPENLHEATEKVLYNLTADESLKQRILQRAVESGTKKSRRFAVIPAFCSVMVVLMLVLAGMNGLKPVDPSASYDINVFSAGSSDVAAPVENAYEDIFDSIKPENVVSVELSDLGTVTDPEACASLISLLQHNSVSADHIFGTAVHTLHIKTSDGTDIAFSVDEPFIGNESSWSCAEFFDKLYQLIDP